MVDLDSDALDELLSGDNPWLQVATIASSSTSLFASPSTFPSDATTNWGTPASTNTCLIQPSIPVPCTTSSQGATVDLDVLEHLLSLSGENAWPEMANSSSSSPSFFASPSIFPSDAETTTASATLSSANPCWFNTSGASSSVREGVGQARCCIQFWMPYMTNDGEFVLTVCGAPFWNDRRSDCLEWFRTLSVRSRFSAHSPSPSPSTSAGFLSIEPLIRRVAVDVLTTDVSTIPRTKKRGISSEMSQKRQPEEGERPRWGVGGGGGGGPAESGGSSSHGEPKRQRVPALREVIMEAMRKRSIEKLLLSIEPLIRRVAVDVLTTDVSTIPRTKLNTVSYEEAIPEILEVLKAACIIHKLPLAQTWATCAQQGKRGGHHSDENYRYCISTIDAACYVNDPRMQIFHEVCSEHHLLPGQGVAGKAFTTNQLCFLPDIGSSSEKEYPLCHHAKIFKLKGAVAIRLRCTRAGKADFVLEFFLPRDCGVLEEQKAVLDFLWGTVRSLFQTLRMVTGKEMEDDAMWEMNEINSFDLQNNKKANKRKRMARRSPVWRSFTEVMVGDNVKAKCNHCGLELCCDSKIHGTSSLKSHLERCKLNPNNRITGPL